LPLLLIHDIVIPTALSSRTNSLVDYHANPTGQVVTDEFGNTLTITGPVTRTWVTTLPNGVVSTVTEVLTPTVEVPGSGPSPMEP